MTTDVVVAAPARLSMAARLLAEQSDTLNAGHPDGGRESGGEPSVWAAAAFSRELGGYGQAFAARIAAVAAALATTAGAYAGMESTNSGALTIAAQPG